VNRGGIEMSEKKCPICNSIIVFLGEGSYGKCSNDECKFTTKKEGCDVPDCDDMALEEEKKDLTKMED
jgi:hypothetical protein